MEGLDLVCDEIVEEKTGKPNSWWKERIHKKEFWFGVDEAKKFGVVTAELE
jgi:ATP-dependent protease ClpP protease subunit